MSFWNKITRRYLAAATPSGKPGARAYAVGDIHGRLDLLNELLAMIEADISAHPEQETHLVFLGDLIDRGPDSAGVVQRLMDYRLAGVNIIYLGGNHEEILLGVLREEPGQLEKWLRFGGAECAQSYGVDAKKLERVSDRQGADILRKSIPSNHVEFLNAMSDTFRFGGYLFVHAGIRPGVPLIEQTRRDLRWIREPFLSDEGDHDLVIVHGHTVTDGVDERANRIGIDTGAVYNGLLTSLVIDGTVRRYLMTGPVNRDTPAINHLQTELC